MNLAPDQTIPPAAPGQIDPARKLVLVTLSIPAIEGMTPPGNRIGTLIVQCSLESALSAGGMGFTGGGTTGELNQARFVVFVDNWRRSIEIITAELNQAGLLGSATVGWFDDDEGILRLVHPERREIEWPGAVIHAEAETEAKFVASLAAQLTRCLQQSNSDPANPS